MIIVTLLANALIMVNKIGFAILQYSNKLDFIAQTEKANKQAVITVKVKKDVKGLKVQSLHQMADVRFEPSQNGVLDDSVTILKKNDQEFDNKVHADD